MSKGEGIQETDEWETGLQQDQWGKARCVAGEDNIPKEGNSNTLQISVYNCLSLGENWGTSEDKQISCQYRRGFKSTVHNGIGWLKD